LKASLKDTNLSSDESHISVTESIDSESEDVEDLDDEENCI